MLLRDLRTKRPLRASIEWVPFIVDEHGDAYLAPAVPASSYRVEVEWTSPEEREAMREHGFFLEAEPPLVFMDAKGARHSASLELVGFIRSKTCEHLDWVGTADDMRSLEKRGFRLVGGHRAEIRRLWLFGAAGVPAQRA